MKTRDIKTIDITAKEWFDKVNGNSYFSARLTVNYCMKNNFQIAIPFQYGYGNQYQWEAVKQMAYVFNLKKIKELSDLWRMKKQIILRSHIDRGCKKADVVEWGR